jgi:hypothetical protein
VGRNLCAQQTAASVHRGCLLLHQSASAKCPCIPTTPRGLGLGQGPQGSEMGMGGGARSGAWLPILGLCSLLSGGPQFFVSWNDSVLAPAIVGALATNHLWGAAGGARGERGMSQGCRGIHSGSHGTGPGQSAGRLLAQRPCLPRWPLHPDGVSGQQTKTLTSPNLLLTPSSHALVPTKI